MRKSLAVAIPLAVLPIGAGAFSVNPKAMARFDVSYARCEATFAAMRGHRDEVYLAMWRLEADEKARAQLATVRKSDAYREQRRLALQDETKGALDADKLKAQCEALWGETQKQRALRRAK